MRFYSFLILTIFVFSCGSQKITITNNDKVVSYQRGDKSYKTQYFLDLESNNTYTLVNLDKKPQPVQGENQMIADMYREIIYPAFARENNIQGTVLLETVVNKKGEITHVSINKSVDEILDKEAIRAYKIATKDGFEPFVYDGKATQFKYIFPVKFSFE